MREESGSQEGRKERPILMSGAMVRAILVGRKTQTRRVVNFKKIAKATGCTKGRLAYSPTFNSWAVFDGNGEADLALVDCPYGKVGDRLWVKETFKENEPPSGYIYRASEAEYGYTYEKPWKPSIFMPRQASRIDLEIKAIRVERLKDISEADAIAEGIEQDGNGWKGYVEGNLPRLAFPQNSYKTLWESINGAGSWDLNPWVWVIEFRKVEEGAGLTAKSAENAKRELQECGSASREASKGSKT